jgi:hypothetical protein
MATSSHINQWSAAMPQPNDLSRSLVALDHNSTIIAIVELSQSSWLVGGVLPGIERQPRKKLEPSPERLVYVNPPPSEKLDIHTPGYVGNLALFGLKPHAMAGHPPPPAVDIYVQYDISQLVREALAGNPKDLTVVLVPRGLFGANGEPLPVPQETQGTVGSTQIMGH